jgi:dynein heavy chain
VKKEFSQLSPVLPRSHPNYAGMAVWARGLKRRIDGPMKSLEFAFFLHEKGQGEEAKCQYLQLAQLLEEFVGKNFNDWVVTVEKELTKYLDQPLMIRYVIQYMLFVCDDTKCDYSMCHNIISALKQCYCYLTYD